VSIIGVERWIKVGWKHYALVMSMRMSLISFLEFAQQNAHEMGEKYLCPYVKCGSKRQHVENNIKTHLICNGIIPSYTRWIWHGQLHKYQACPKLSMLMYTWEID